MVEFNHDDYEVMYGRISEVTEGTHLYNKCSCACHCSCHCNCKCRSYNSETEDGIEW